jgi:hypothetical protein
MALDVIIGEDSVYLPTRVAYVVLTLGLLVVMPIDAYSQLSLDIHGRDISLGMERHAVLTKLKGYRLQCFGEPSRRVTECNSLLVQSDVPPYDPHANVVFENGRVKSIRKYWSRGFEGTAPGRFVQTLYTILTNQGAQKPMQFDVSVSERRGPGVLQQAIFLTSGGKTIFISYTEGLRDADGNIIPPFVNLDESVQ